MAGGHRLAFFRSDPVGGQKVSKEAIRLVRLNLGLPILRSSLQQQLKNSGRRHSGSFLRNFYVSNPYSRDAAICDLTISAKIRLTMKTAVLASLFGAAAAFAPAQNGGKWNQELSKCTRFKNQFSQRPCPIASLQGRHCFERREEPRRSFPSIPGKLEGIQW